MNIYKMILHHETEKLKDYVKLHPNKVNVLEDGYHMPINYAALCGNIECCKILLEHGARKGHKFYIEQLGTRSPIFHAVTKDYISCVLWLDKHGFPMSPMPFIINETLFTYAIEKGSHSVIYNLIDKVDVNYSAPLGYPPLTKAILTSMCTYDKCELIKRLIRNGANVNGMDSNGHILLLNEDGTTNDSRFHVPITAAVGAYSRFEDMDTVVKLLVDNGADINQKGFSMTPLEVAKATYCKSAKVCVEMLGGK